MIFNLLWKKIKRYFCCNQILDKPEIQIETGQPESQPPTVKDKEPQILINDCCEMCNDCYQKLTGNNPSDFMTKGFITSPEDSQYWFTKAMKYTGIYEKEIAFLHFLEYHLIGGNNRELFHNWLIKLKQSKNPWEDWSDLISKKKSLDDYFREEPKVIIHGELAKRLSNIADDDKIEYEVIN